MILVLLSVLLAAQPMGDCDCGPYADRTAVQNATVSYFNAHLHSGSKKIDSTYIMAVVVSKKYAEADISYAGQASYYWAQSKGAWTFAGNAPPKSWPASITKKFSTMSNQRAAGSKACTNPAFVPRGSG